MKCCANCKFLSPDKDSDSGEQQEEAPAAAVTAFINLQGTDTVYGRGGGYTDHVTVESAFKTVFEYGIRLQQVGSGSTAESDTSDETYGMCHQCSSLLSELYCLYVEFMKLTKFSSVIQRKLGDSVVWNEGQFCDEDKKPTVTLMSTISASEHGEGADPSLSALLGWELQLASEDVKPTTDPIDLDNLPLNYLPDVMLTRLSSGGITKKLQHSEADSHSRRKLPTKSAATKTRKSCTTDKKKIKTKVETKSHRVGTKILFQKSKHGKYRKVLPCRVQGCAEKFFCSITRLYHESKVHAARVFPCTESDCNEVYHIRSRLDWHMIVAHGIGEKHKDQECPNCCKYFPSASQMRIHLKNEQTEDKDKVHCTLCNTKFLKESGLRWHMKQCHQEYKCEFCDKSFKTSKSYRYHQKTKHLGTAKTYTCKVCNKSSTRIEFLREHEEMHSEFELPCEVCGKMLRGRKNLQRHQRSIHSENKKTYTCPHCGDVFQHQRGVLRHTRLKHSEKLNIDPNELPYVCELCGQGFKIKDYLYAHKISKMHGGLGQEIYRQSRKSTKIDQQEQERH